MSATVILHGGTLLSWQLHLNSCLLLVVGMLCWSACCGCCSILPMLVKCGHHGMFAVNELKAFPADGMCAVQLWTPWAMCCSWFCVQQRHLPKVLTKLLVDQACLRCHVTFVGRVVIFFYWMWLFVQRWQLLRMRMAKRCWMRQEISWKHAKVCAMCVCVWLYSAFSFSRARWIVCACCCENMQYARACAFSECIMVNCPARSWALFLWSWQQLNKVVLFHWEEMLVHQYQIWMQIWMLHGARFWWVHLGTGCVSSLTSSSSLNEQCCHLSHGGSNSQLVCHTTLLPHQGGLASANELYSKYFYI